jgi:hypothetical protein
VWTANYISLYNAGAAAPHGSSSRRFWQKMSDDRIDEIIDSIFDTVELEGGQIKYSEYISLIASHPLVEGFLRS